MIELSRRITSMKTFILSVVSSGEEMIEKSAWERILYFSDPQARLRKKSERTYVKTLSCMLTRLCGRWRCDRLRVISRRDEMPTFPYKWLLLLLKLRQNLITIQLIAEELTAIEFSAGTGQASRECQAADSLLQEWWGLCWIPRISSRAPSPWSAASLELLVRKLWKEEKNQIWTIFSALTKLTQNSLMVECTRSGTSTRSQCTNRHQRCGRFFPRQFSLEDRRARKGRKKCHRLRGTKMFATHVDQLWVLQESSERQVGKLFFLLKVVTGRGWEFLEGFREST